MGPIGACLSWFIDSLLQRDDLFYEQARMRNSVTLPVNIYSTRTEAGRARQRSTGQATSFLALPVSLSTILYI